MNEDTTKYYADGVARVLKMLKDTFGDQFKAYFNGQPEEVPTAALPCIMVSETAGRITSGATGTDDIDESILIVIALNRMDDVGGDPEKDLTEYKLRKLVKGQDPNTMQYLPETIMYAIRTHITLEDAVIDNEIQTDFDIAQRGKDTYTQEAYITLNIRRLALVPSRD